MSLSKKIVFTLLPLLIAIIAISFYGQWRYVLPTFQKLEQHDAITNFERVAANLNSDIEMLDLLNKDWGAWDETYSFIQGHNPKYIASNLGIESFRNGKFDFLFFFNESHYLIWQGIYDSNRNTLVSDDRFTQSVIDRLQTKFANVTSPTINADANYKGLILLNQRPVAYSIRPILMSNESGPSKGLIVRGRYVDTELVSDIIEQTHVRFQLIPIDNKSIQVNNEFLIEELGNHTLEVSRYLFSDNKPIMLMKSYFQRDISQQGTVAIQSAIIISTLLGILLLIAVWFILKKIVIAPITQLTASATSITYTRNYQQRTHVKSDDEIGKLSEQLNEMLHAIENRELQLEEILSKVKRLSMTDSLTNIANRLKFDSVSDIEWRRMKRERKPMSIIMCDVDFFKQYNDHYGHIKGDESLVLVAKALNETLSRPADLVARFGGEEFVLLLPNTEIEGATHIAETALNKILSLKITHPNSEVCPYLTASFGIASMVPSVENSILQLISDADKALYQAKQKGRNTIEVIASSRAENIKPSA
ncbi:diguanylate cyclase [Vibrio sp. B1Z05]|uniref:sensor domain-containing diguanylate cyclase n=1 Tax=Vibrio sp. B1Z05 TaxID=2654980 RepID=UPI00128B936B|nr:diguanylate cyclase [Vibrio sp. B1Z05]MPW36066.1 diguanylate cyclase [Vibrio sp. B1Z05]